VIGTEPYVRHLLDRIAELEAALVPFSQLADGRGVLADDAEIEVRVCVGDLRCARAAIRARPAP
jgi:hypothetical protein